MGIFIKSNSASEDCASGWMIPYIIYIEFYIYIYIYIYIQNPLMQLVTQESQFSYMDRTQAHNSFYSENDRVH